MTEVTVAETRTKVDLDVFVPARGPGLPLMAWLLTGDRQRAEDLAQTALGKAWPRCESGSSQRPACPSGHGWSWVIARGSHEAPTSGGAGPCLCKAAPFSGVAPVEGL